MFRSTHCGAPSTNLRHLHDDTVRVLMTRAFFKMSNQTKGRKCPIDMKLASFQWPHSHTKQTLVLHHLMTFCWCWTCQSRRCFSISSVSSFSRHTVTVIAASSLLTSNLLTRSITFLNLFYIKCSHFSILILEKSFSLGAAR